MWSPIIFNRGGVRITLAPVRKDFLWVFLLLAVANILLAAINFIRPYWTWLRASLQLALTIAGAVAFCALVKANLLFEIVIPNLAPERATHLVNAINTNAAKSFPFAIFAGVIIVGLSGVGPLIRLRTKGSKLVQRVAVILLLAGLGINLGAQRVFALRYTREFCCGRVE